MVYICTYSHRVGGEGGRLEPETKLERHKAGLKIPI
jgi:hypothetical protein